MIWLHYKSLNATYKTYLWVSIINKCLVLSHMINVDIDRFVAYKTWNMLIYTYIFFKCAPFKLI